MTTQVYTQNISVYNEYKLIGAVAPNLYFKNTGTGTLDATLILCLCQHTGLGNENITNFQCWVKKGIAPNEEINMSGAYFLSDTNLTLILNEMNGDPQTLRLILNVTGGVTEDDRLALIKQTYTDVIDYSVNKGKY